jgi:EmrB/QacA subfamily drug resistance transporter
MREAGRPDTGGARQRPTGPDRRRVAIALIVATAFLMQGVDSTLLTTAIPAIARGLDVTPLALHLAVTAYIISLAVFMPLSSWLADRIGTRRVFCGALIVFVAGSALCGMAANLPMLIAARVLQGLGGAVMTPVGRLILLRAFGAGGTLEAMSYLTLPMVLGPLLGPMLGATLVTYASWRWIFFVNLPICGLALGAALAMVPQDRPAEAAPRFDFSGFAMSAMAIVLFQFGLENLAEPALGHLASLGLFAAAVALALLYLAHARKVPHPALDLSLFSVRAYRAGVVGGGLSRIGLNASAFLLPLLLQLGFGMTPLLAGTLTAIGALGALSTRFVLRRLVNSLGYRRVLVGLVVAGAAMLAGFPWLAWIGSLPVLVACIVLFTGIRAMQFNAVNALTYADIPPSLLSRSVGSAGVFQQLSMGLGISVSAAVLSATTGANGTPALQDFPPAFLFMAGVTLTALPWLLHLRQGDGLGQASGTPRAARA